MTQSLKHSIPNIELLPKHRDPDLFGAISKAKVRMNVVPFFAALAIFCSNTVNTKAAKVAKKNGVLPKI
jgi:hypothetical protein